MSPTTTPATPHTTTTNGWDTVYALYFPDVNLAIANAKSSPPSFTQTEDGMTLTGTFGDWQLAAGGDGKNLHMTLPIPTSTFSGMGAPVTCSAITATIEINLLWKNPDGTTALGGSGPAAGTPPPAPSTPNLKVNHATTDKTQPAVSIVAMDYKDNTLTSIQQGIYQQLVLDWLNANLQDFAHVFSTITLNTILDTNAGFQWMLPTTTLYAIVDKEDSTGADDFAKSTFAVLCMTENRPSPGVHEVDPFAIPDGANSAFLISPARVLENMFLPGLPHMFQGMPATSCFTVDDTTITNNVELQFTDQRLDNDRIVNPTIPAGNFIIELVGNQVQISMHGLYFDYTPGFKVTMDHVSNATFVLNSDFVFKMQVVGTPTTSASVSISKGAEIGMIVMSIGLAVAGAAVGGFLGGAASAAATAPVVVGEEAAVAAVTTAVEEGAEDAVSNITTEAVADAASQVSGLAGKFSNFFAANWAKMLGAFIGGSIGGATSAIPAIIEKIANDKADDIYTLNDFGTQMMAPLVWPNMETKGERLVNGSLNGALQVGINLTPVNVPAAAPAAA